MQLTYKFSYTRDLCECDNKPNHYCNYIYHDLFNSVAYRFVMIKHCNELYGSVISTNIYLIWHQVEELLLNLEKIKNNVVGISVYLQTTKLILNLPNYINYLCIRRHKDIDKVTIKSKRLQFLILSDCNNISFKFIDKLPKSLCHIMISSNVENDSNIYMFMLRHTCTTICLKIKLGDYYVVINPKDYEHCKEIIKIYDVNTRIKKIPFTLFKMHSYLLRNNKKVLLHIVKLLNYYHSLS